jgi:hypothetical protein
MVVNWIHHWRLLRNGKNYEIWPRLASLRIDNWKLRRARRKNNC